MTDTNVTGATCHTRDFLRGRRRSELSAEEKAVLESLVERIETIPARKLMTHRGDRVTASTILIDGFTCRWMDARDGYRQLVAYQVPGDFIDLHGFPTRHIDHDIGTLTEATVGIVPHERLQTVLETRPHLAKLLWFSTLLDAALHREWIFRIGRLDAMGRVAHFVSETHLRMAAVGRAENGVFAMPLTQQDIGEACGLTSVHVNRTLRRLREDGLMELGRGTARILDEKKLSRLGEFDPDYLYLKDGPWHSMD